MSRLLGIDIAKNVVRTATIRTSYKRVTVEALGEVTISSAGNELEAIKAAVGALKPDAVSIALSGERSFYRRVDLPAAAMKELQNVLGFELEATIPFEMTDAVFDYRILKRDPASPTLPIFAAIARLEDVRERIAIVKDAIGVEPERVGTGAFPLTNLREVIPELDRHPAAAPGKPIAILNLNETTSDVLILEDGEPVFARTLSRGTEGLPDTAPVIARELRQTLASWRTMGGEPLGGMYLVGGGASVHGAEHFLSTELGVSILPLPKPRLDGLTPEQEAMLPRFAEALGLALGLSGRSKAFNLRRGPLEAARSYPFLREKVPLFAGLGVVIAMSFGFSVFAELSSLDAENEYLQAQLAVASRDILGEETTDPTRARELIEPGSGAAEEDPLPHADAFDVMVQLSKAAPKELVHDVIDFDVARGHAVIQGVVPTVSDAQTISENMKEHKCFKDVKIARTSQYSEGKTKYVLELDIKCDSKKKKPAGAEPDGSAQPAGSARPDGKTEGQR
jgi:general secretion pathway protein L